MDIETTAVESELLEREPERERGKADVSRVMALKLAGLTDQAIADTTGLQRVTVNAIVRRSLAEATQDAGETLRAVMHLRLEQMLMGVWPQAVRGDEGAIGTVLRIMERQAQLHGLEVQQVGHSVTNNTVIVADGSTAQYVEAMRKKAGGSTIYVPQPGEIVEAVDLGEGG